MDNEQKQTGNQTTYHDNLKQLMLTNLISKQQHNDIIVNKAIAVLTTKMEDMEMKDIKELVETMEQIKKINSIDEYKEISELLKS